MIIRILSNELIFERVAPIDEQVHSLYELLKLRKHTISHYSIPSYAEHSSFVRNHPYRAWFLVETKSKYVGSVYITSENTVGINVDEEYLSQEVINIINFVNTKCQPLAAIPSVRSGKFAINVPSSSMISTKINQQMTLNL